MALEAAFETVTDIDLVAIARTVEAAVSATAEHRPDLIILDRQLPDGDGIDAIGRLREQHRAVRVLVFTGGADRATVDRVRAAGGDGLALKAGLLDELLATIRRVAAGEEFFEIDPSERQIRR